LFDEPERGAACAVDAADAAEARFTRENGDIVAIFKRNIRPQRPFLLLQQPSNVVPTSRAFVTIASHDAEHADVLKRAPGRLRDFPSRRSLHRKIYTQSVSVHSAV
jgi:hypothetical protein